MTSPLLVVKNLKTYFFTNEVVVKAVDGIDFELAKGGALGIVGESGSGKSVTSLSIIGLVHSPGRVVDGKIIFEGRNLLDLSEAELQRIRGKEIAMVFQEPMTSLNPVFTIGNQISEALIIHQKMSKKEAQERAVELLNMVGIPDAQKRVNDYPHQLSGGMRQRVMIAMAVSCNPKLLIADEPTTALDVTIQRQILDLLRRISEEFGTAIMLITHNLGIIAEFVNQVAVMYLGKIVEYTDTVTLFANPSHPYTIGLLESMPRLDVSRKRLKTIPGTVPPPEEVPSGCAFHPRCEFRKEVCQQKTPSLFTVGDGHKVACWKVVDYDE
ncbi:MAG: ABC transporter ATP-binding protein [Firmicutes bacterium]|nr:ABC transporter ATP-binding protein [Bacillota bacterium]